nr:hypothetical protein [Tanacetum cinerariifolium]
KSDGIFISHDKYVAEILRKFGLTDGKSASTPIDIKKPLLKDPDGEDVDVHTYRSMIGSLMYLNSSRPDIMFAVCACARFQVTPKVSHLHAVKRVFRYLKGKPHLGLGYPKDSPFNLVAYSDSDYAGTGPTWLFDIDSLTRTINYQPVTARNQTNSSAGFQDKFDAKKAGEEVDQQYVLFPVWSIGSINPQNIDEDADFDRKEHAFDVKKPESEFDVSSSSSAQSRKQDDKTKKEAKGKSPIESLKVYRDLNAQFEDCSDNSSNEVNAAGSIVPTVGQNSLNSTNTFNMLELEDITYSDDEDVGAKADFNNLESYILVSPILTTRIHKDHPVSQIIGDLSSTTQTRSMTRAFKDQGFEDPDHPDKVYRVVKALYGLHQAPRAWYETLATYLLENVKKIFRYLKGKPHLGLWYPKDSSFDLVAYSDSDYASASLDRKSTTGGCQFLGCRLIFWQCKKQIVVATSSTEAEYVAAASCCVQVQWIQNQLLDYGLTELELEFMLLAKKFLPSGICYCCLVRRIGAAHLVLLGFNQVIDFLNGSYIKYALTINPEIYISCIKQFWNTVVIKQTNNVTRLQALVDKKKVVVTEAAIREVLQLDDAEVVDCLPNKEIFAELARMGYEKPSTKLTFYKAFFSSQWKFLIHTILQSLSAKHTLWNEFSSAMVSAVICLSTGRKFNFSKFIFDSLVRNVDTTLKFYMYPRFIQFLIRRQLGDLSTYTTKYTSPALTQKVFANMRRVGKGFSGVETPLFEGMIVEQVIEEGGAEGEHVEEDTAAQGDDTTAQGDAAHEPSIPSPTPPTPSTQQPQDLPSTSQGRMIDDLDKDDIVTLMDDKEEEKKEGEAKVVEDDQVHGRQAKIYKIDMDHALKVLIRVVAASTRRRKGVVIRDPKEESSTVILADTKSKDKGKGIMVEDPKPLKKKQQVEMDEEYARKLHDELNKYIDWDVAIEHVKQKAKEDPVVQRYQTKEQMKEEESKAIQSINDTLAQKATKRRKLNEEVKDLKRHLEIVPDEDDDVYTEATPLARKVPVMDYEIIHLNNKPHYKIIQADGTHQLYVSFLTLQKNFDREDLESLWSLVKERFSTSKPNNFSDDFLLTTFGELFERQDGQAQFWKNQRTVHGQAKDNDVTRLQALVDKKKVVVTEAAIREVL